MTAGHADPEVHPRVADTQTVLTAGAGRNDIEVGVGDVSARFSHHLILGGRRPLRLCQSEAGVTVARLRIENTRTGRLTPFITRSWTGVQSTRSRTEERVFSE